MEEKDKEQDITITKVIKDIEYMKKDIHEIKDSIKGLEKIFKDAVNENREEFIKAIDSLDKRKASKWVEKVLIGAGTAIGLALLAAVLSLILK